MAAALAAMTDDEPDPRALEKAAMDVFMPFIRSQASALAGVFRRAVAFAPLDERAHEIVIDKRAVLAALLSTAFDDTSTDGSLYWLADWAVAQGFDASSVDPALADAVAFFNAGARVVGSATMLGQAVPEARFIARIDAAGRLDPATLALMHS
jgi:hypothetical protein